MNIQDKSKLTQLAFYTAVAASIHIVEDLIMRMLPLPFVRLGFSNIVILYLVCHNRIWEAFIVNISKTLLSGIVTLTLLSPSTLLSLTGGISAVIIMVLVRWLHWGLGIYGISICGAITHNLMQLAMVRAILIRSDKVFVLTPILLSIALISGSIIAYLTLYIDRKSETAKITER
ncbi:MAG TPA: Gx transporter family protein [Candidatus Cloacimonas sp.]|jgi:heptaprenyl diphosphate synthase|nr:Gx transporter family protein [Candidatus Cloacimonas sp.]HNS84918.1 Gx transporter family protein [Candidatus Cloacimonas sp.]HQM03652.1 Gx transporter family protein [Candidatus Cloacimonas sp.]